MRQIFVIGALLMAMLGLKSMGLETQGGFEPLFLAALGFVILSAFSSAELVSKINLPKVTGFILAGIILGPQVSDILSLKIVTDTKMFTTLALGLIALSAGLELHLSSLKKMAKTLGFIIIFKLLFLFTIVLFGFYFSLQNINLPVELTNAQMFSLSLIFSALALGTSPSISLAIINESKIKSRMTDLTLGMAVVKDVLVVLTLAVCLTISKTLVDPSSQMSSDVFIGLAQEIFFSLLVGSLLGGLLILYLRFIKLEMLLFVTLVIIGVAEISTLLHLELLLVFITAGFVVTNFSKYEHDLLSPIEKVSLPVFIIFFTNIGAALDLNAIEKVLPIAICLFVLRALAFYISSLMGTRLAQEDDKIIKNSWLCFLPQAGVTLGLIGIAAKQMPSLGSMIENIGMGLVGLNLMVGPVTLRMGLNNTRDGKDLPQSKDKEEVDVKSELSADLNEICEKYLINRKKVVAELIQKLFIKPSTSLLREFSLNDFRVNAPLLDNIEKFEKVTDILSNKSEEMSELRKTRIESFEELPQVVEERLSSAWLEIKNSDSLTVRFRKRILKLKKFFKIDLKKQTLVRACFRKHLYVHYIQNERMITEKWMLTLFAVNNAFETLLSGELDKEQFLEKVNESFTVFNKTVLENCSDDLKVEFRGIKSDLDLSGSPYSSRKNLRFSKYSSQISQIEEKVKSSVEKWQKVFGGYRNQMIIKNKLSLLQEVTEDQINSKVIAPVQYFITKAGPEVEKSKIQLETLATQLSHAKFSMDEVTLLLKKIRDNLDLQRVSAERVIEHGFEKYIFSAISHLSHLDRNHKILSPQFLLNPNPEKAEYKVINLSETIMLQIEGKLIPELSRQASQLHQSLMKQIYQYLEVIERMILRSEGLEALSGTEINEFRVDFNVDLKILQSYSHELSKCLENSLKEFQDNKTELLSEIFNDFDSLETREIYYSQTSSRILKLYGKLSLKFKKTKGHLQLKFDRILERFKFAKNEFKDSEISKKIKIKVKENKIDSATIKKYLTFVYQKPFLDEIPQTYRRLFTFNELYDDRFFTNEKMIGEFSQESVSTNKYLIVGEAGSGKSTALNVLAKKYNNELIEIRRNSYLRQMSLYESLANVLNCKKEYHAILKELDKKQRTILIDDLNIWWRPSQISELDQFFDILSKTQEKTVWLVSIGSLGYTRLKDTFQFTSFFEELLFLEKVEKDKTLEFIEKRHRYSGRELHFPETLSNRYLKNIARRGNEKLFLQYIYELSGGNPRLLCFLWLRSINLYTSREVRTTFKNVEVGNFDFINVLSESQRLVLTEIVSFQSRSLQDLSESLAFESEIIKKDLEYLERSLLVAFAKGYYIIPSLVDRGVEQFIMRSSYGK